MPTPLVMLGSGDYTTRLHVKGTRLLKTKGNPAPGTHAGNPDPDQAPNHSGYHRPDPTFHRGKFSPKPSADFPSHAPHRDPDTFDLTAPLHAACAWLQLQSLTLSDLAQSARHDADRLPSYKAADAIGGLHSPTNPTPQPAFVRALRAAKAKLRAAQSAPRIRIAPVPADFHDFALVPPFGPRAATRLTLAAASPQTPNPKSQPLTRRDPDESDPQTAENPQPHPRNPLDPRLFADDAGARRRAGRLQGHRLRTRRSPDQKGSPQTAGQQSPLFGSLA